MNSRHTNLNNQGRNDKLIQQRVHDPYKSQQKLTEPTVCPDCHAVFSGGRWQWLTDTTKLAYEQRCPACRRIDEKVPAGILTMQGQFLQDHSDEIMNLLHNKVETEMALHPLKRLMTLEESEDGKIVATFTDTHLPRDIGKALEHAYKGSLDIDYAEDEDFTRVNWSR